MPTLSLAFDVAQGFPYLFNINHFFMTHGHLDHAAGIPYLISQKSMSAHKQPTFYMPHSMIEPMKQIMSGWAQIEKYEYPYQFVGVKETDTFEINRNYFVRPFKTVHRVDSFGYTLFHTKTKLKPAMALLSQNELREVRESGQEITQQLETPLVSFTGDTQIEFLDAAPWIKKSKILFLESTYLDQDKSIQSARDWGHTHLDEIIPRLDELECEKIVLIHSSARYSLEHALDLLIKKIPPQHQNKVILFPGR
ncbi:MAG: MBL fold metallo-hydrolase [Bdellovibrio sp.]|nr:MBL fold metallo-hydrolase [Bdellovibrio sp.]